MLRTTLAILIAAASTMTASAGSWKFAVVADSRGDGAATSTAWVNTNVLQAIARGITNDRAEFVLFAGDLIYGSNTTADTNLLAQYAAWSNAFAPVYSAGIPVYPVRGGHEVAGDTNGEIYLSVFSNSVPANGPTGEVGLTYSFTHKNGFFIGLDQYKNPHRINQVWLDSQLATRSAWLVSNRCPHVFVFGHEPAVQASHADCLARENAARDAFLNAITEAGCRIYFCGHDHFYNRARLMPRNGINIMQAIVGTGGGPFYTWDGIYGKDYGEQNLASNCYYSAYTNGYVLVTISNFNVKMVWKAASQLSGGGGPAAPRAGISSNRSVATERDGHLMTEKLQWKGPTGPFDSDLSARIGTQDGLTTWQTYDTYSYQLTNTCIRNVNDYDGDNKADLAVYSESEGAMITALSTSNYISFISYYGGLGALMAPGDYDGDGISDPTVYWKESGLWDSYLSDRNYASSTNTLGGSGYFPVPADYDGDAKTDLAVYQKSSGNWSVVFSSNGINSAGAWGGPGWTPVPSDYDGDQKADIVVYHKSTGNWAALLSAGREPGNYVPGALSWGGTGYLPACADYDNDQRTDPAIYDKNYSYLLVMQSSRNYEMAYAFLNTTNAVPVVGDYDRDGKFDPMVYNQFPASWIGALSASGYQLNSAVFGGGDWSAVRTDWPADLVFMAFGDSITYGGGSSSDGPATGYPILLETKLKQNYAGYFLSINSGNPGETTENGLGRFQRVLYTYNSDLVLLMEGTNDEFYGDPYEQTEDNLRAMVQYTLALGKKVIIATIPPVISNQYRNRDDQQARIIGFNPRIYRIAADYNIPVAPVFEAITAVPNWQNALMDQPSANHPNDAGYAVIRDTFYAIISAGLDDGTY